MGITYHYANLSKGEWFSADALGGNSKRAGLGRSLTARAFDLLLIRGMPHAGSTHVAEGRWAGDGVALIGDTEDDWLRLRENFRDIEADVILMLFRSDGFEDIAAAAQTDTGLFMELCHLVATRQASELEPHLKQHFGPSFLRRYKELAAAERRPGTQKDIAFPPG